MQQANSKEEKHRSDLARSQRYDRDVCVHNFPPLHCVVTLFAVGFVFAVACVLVQRPGHWIYENTGFP